MEYLFYIFVLGIFGFIVYYDAYLLREKDARLYDGIIKIPPLQLGLLSAGLILLVVPIYFYLYLRRGLVKELGAAQVPGPDLLSDALGIVVRWVAGIILISLSIRAVNFLLPGFNNKLAGLLLSTVISLGLILFFIYQAVRSYPQMGLKEIIAWQKPRVSAAASYGAAIILGALFASASTWLTFNRVENPATPLSDAIYANESMTVMLVFYWLAIFVAPAIEEIIFRGYFFTAVSSRQGNRFAFLVVGFAFAFLHVHQYWGDGLAIVFVTGLGYVLTYLRLRTQSVWPSVVMHTVYNGLVSLLPVVIFIKSQGS